MILEIVTTEETIYSGESDIVIAPGVEGQLGILPRHAPLLTAVANQHTFQHLYYLRLYCSFLNISLSIGFFFYVT